MPLSLQLYSMRNAPDQERVLDACAAAGVGCVEGYAGVLQNPSAFKDVMDGSGVTMPSVHIALDDIEQDSQAVIDLVKPLGVEKVIAPYLEPAKRPKTAEGYIRIANLLAERGKQFADHGMTLGWHNHDFELEALEDSAVPMLAMFDAQPDLPWEADLGWVARSGADTMSWLTDYMSNIQAIHVKDIAAAGENLDEDGWADLGDGNMDWTNLIRTTREAKPDMLFVLEHDNPSDPYRYLERSAKAFHAIWEATNG